jgi:ATP-dependent protease ClpP protease subunit
MEKIIKKSAKILSKELPFGEIFTAKPARMVEWIGGVNNENLDRTLARIKNLMLEDPAEEIQLVINSHGGATGIGMAFRDTVNSILRANLTTIGSGDVDSSGVTLLLSGQKRYLTKNTTLLLHLAGRTFGTDRRFSTEDMENILKEDRLKDYQYACVISDATRGRYSPEKVLEMMRATTVLTAEEAVNMGLAHKVL